jgi:single-strand DNA-binding protein
MASINKVILLGNVTRDPDKTYTPKGTVKTQLGLAVNERWKDAAGEMKEQTTFVDCVIWGKSGESAATHVTKGTALFIEGRLSQEEWQDKTTGQTKRKTRVIVESWQFAGPKRDTTDRPSTGPRPPAQRDTIDTVFTQQPQDEEIPF